MNVASTRKMAGWHSGHVNHLLYEGDGLDSQCVSLYLHSLKHCNFFPLLYVISVSLRYFPFLSVSFRYFPFLFVSFYFFLLLFVSFSYFQLLSVTFSYFQLLSVTFSYFQLLSVSFSFLTRYNRKRESCYSIYTYSECSFDS